MKMIYKGRDWKTGLPIPDVEAMRYAYLEGKTKLILSQINLATKEVIGLTKKVEARLNKEGKSLFK